MEFLKIFLVIICLCMCYCQQQENMTDPEKDFTNVSNVTEVWNFTTSFDHDNSTTPKEDIIITRPTDNISNTSFTDNENSSPIPSTVATTPKQKETNFSACEINPCKNGGTCLENFYDSRVYSCICQMGFTGNLCGVKDYCVGNGNAACKNGYCAYSTDRLSKTCNCFFGMYWDNLKEECREPEVPCFPNPCQNGGECKVVENEKYACECSTGYEGPTCAIQNKCGVNDVCSNGVCKLNENSNFKSCTCSDGKYWNIHVDSCEDVKFPCVPNPCSNHGICNASSDGDYSCNCTGHYLGKNCNKDNLCYSSDESGTECGGNGKCKIDNSETKCVCNEGYYWDSELRSCIEKVPPCFPNPCANNGLCTPIDEHNFNCTCSEGYTGTVCKDLNFCVFQGGNKLCGNATCESDSDAGTFKCRCEKGFYFDFTHMKCMQIDFCPLMKCGAHERCVNSECICQENYRRDNETNKCKANFCAVNPCPANDMKCTEGDGITDYYCSCKKGYSFNGTQCIEAVCVFPEFNECEQSCTPSGGEYTCHCDKDYFAMKEDNKTCSYTGNTTCSNKTCAMGKCFKDDTLIEKCACPSGYVEEDGNCKDVCSLKLLTKGICPNNQCEATKDGFRCKCEGKFILSKDKITCTNRRMCQTGEKGQTDCASKNAICIDDWKSDLGYRCQCTFPQKESNQGVCQDICSNEEYQRNCSDLGAKCDIDLNGDVMCRCPPLYKQPENGGKCNKPADISYLATIPIDLDSYRTGHSRQSIRSRSLDLEYEVDLFQVQTDVEIAFSKIFTGLIGVSVLNCKKGTNYFLCKLELQFVSIKEEELKRMSVPDLCTSNDTNSDKCLIPPSLILIKDQIKTMQVKKSDPCDTDVKENICGLGTTCLSSVSKDSFNCTCGTGFEVRYKKYPFAATDSFIEICNDVNECLVDNICPQHTTCKNQIGSYTCSCLPGYRLKDKLYDAKLDGCVEICNPNPCDHGTCEKKWNGDFECRCEVGFNGILCDSTDSNLKGAQTNTVVVGAVLGGVLLITIIIFIVTVQRLKRKKYENEPDQMLYATEMTERRGGGAVNNAYQ